MESFTDQVKHELTRIDNKEQQVQLAELAALIRMDGSIQIVDKQLAVSIKLYHGDLARKIYSRLREEYEFDIEILVSRSNNFSNNHVYELVLYPQPGLKEFLIKLGFLNANNNLVFNIKDEFIEDKDCQRSYLRGVFLGGGSVNDPHGEYHLEIRCEHQSQAEDIIQLLQFFNLDGHLTEHKAKYVIYFKNYLEIKDFLRIIGADDSIAKMEKIHLLKEVKNNVNRKVNGETANLDKTIEAALGQLENIQLIEEKKGLSGLPQSLQEIAVLRKEHPYASLKELGELLTPQLSKSGVNHRLRRIKKIAKKIRGEK